jgi:adenine-specific DNA glycosylase
VVVDYYTRWMEAFPCVHKDAVTCANILNKEVFSRYYLPCTD